jgi:hypothetical protein
MVEPNWWTQRETGAWERVREALERDWEQTKADFSGRHSGHDLNQQLADTFKQVAGTEAIPPIDVSNSAAEAFNMDDAFNHVEPAFRYGVGTGSKSAEDQEWDAMLEQELSMEWSALAPTKPWIESKNHVRRGWEAIRAARKGQSGKIGWALLWLLGIPLPVLLVLYLIRGH